MIIPLSDLRLSSNEITNKVIDEIKDFCICIRINSGKMGQKYSCYYLSFEDTSRVNEGVSDLIIVLPKGDTLWLEIKGYNDKQRKSQKAFEAMLKKLGHKYKIISQNEIYSFCRKLRGIYGQQQSR